MQVPYRKKETYRQPPLNPHITLSKFQELKNNLEKLEKKQRLESQEVKRLAAMGDFSENAGYQLAKGRLRGLNYRILKIQNQLKQAEIIPEQPNNDRVQLGNTVSIDNNGKISKYQILGSLETNPKTGIISNSSPLGQALLGQQLGDIIEMKLRETIKKYKIIKIE